MRDLYINNPIRYVESLNEEQKKNIKLDILFFPLEQSAKDIITLELSKHLHLKYRKEVSSKELLSIGRQNYLSDEIFNLIEDTKEHIDMFNKYVKIYDNIFNPTGIYNKVKEFAFKIGFYHRKNGEFYSEETKKRMLKDGKGFTPEELEDFGGYKTYHKNHYVIVIVDHKSILQTENNESLRETMYKFSSKYCLYMKNKFGFTPVMVQQFMNDKENVETNFQGKTLEEKLEPTNHSFADNKSSTKDADIVLGLFNPYRYNILKYKDYDLKILKNNFRTLHILKNRYGEVGMKIPMFFTGKTGIFKELPKAEDTEEMKKYYDYSLKLQKELADKINN